MADPPAEPLVEGRVVGEAQPLAEEPYLLLCPEEALPFLFADLLPLSLAEQVDIFSQGLILGGEAHPGR